MTARPMWHIFPYSMALHHARPLTLDGGRDREVHAELREHHIKAGSCELAAGLCPPVGGNRMARSWGIEPEDLIPAGAMSIHGQVAR